MISVAIPGDSIVTYGSTVNISADGTTVDSSAGFSPVSALKLNGSSGGVYTNLTLPSSAYPNLNLTISAWIKIDGTTSDTSGKNIVASFDSYEGRNSPGVGYANNGNWFVEVGNTIWNTTQPAAMSGGWHNVVVVFSSSSPNYVRFYYDGVLKATDTTAPNWGSASGVSGHLTIGYDAASSGTELIDGFWQNGFSWVNGAINEVNVWNTALSMDDNGSDDIAALYNSGIGITSGQPRQASLIAGYHLEGDASDFTGNGNDGSLFGNTADAAFNSSEGFQEVAGAPYVYTGSDSSYEVSATTSSGATGYATAAVAAASTTTLTASATTIDQGDDVTLTATVTGSDGGTPTGTVRFFNGPDLIGTAPLDDTGTASIDTTSLPLGAQNLNAVYSGDSTYAGSSTPSTAPTTVTVLAVATPLVTSSADAAGVGQTVYLTATVSLGAYSTTTTAPTVTFENNGRGR